MPHTSLPNYPVIDEVFTHVRSLGVGTNAEVFLAHRVRENAKSHAPNQEPVALKILHESLHTDRQLVERFYAEAALLERAGQHPHLVALYNAGVLHGRHTLVLEPVHGVTLRQFLEGHATSISPAIALEIIRQTAAALHAIQSFWSDTNFVHGDLSPANILIDTNGKVRLIDFDVALEIQQDTGRSSMGTLPYTSPEQCAELPLDTRSDLFVLGILLWELLRGHSPYPRFDPAHAMLTIAETQISSPLAASNHPHVARVHNIWAQLQHLDRDARFDNTTELLEAIDAADIRHKSATQALLATQVQRLVNAPNIR